MNGKNETAPLMNFDARERPNGERHTVNIAGKAVGMSATNGAYMAFIFGLSSISHTPSLPHGSDKGLHALLYSGLGALFARARAGGWRGRG